MLQSSRQLGMEDLHEGDHLHHLLLGALHLPRNVLSHHAMGLQIPEDDKVSLIENHVSDANYLVPRRRFPNVRQKVLTRYDTIDKSKELIVD